MTTSPSIQNLFTCVLIPERIHRRAAYLRCSQMSVYVPVLKYLRVLADDPVMLAAFLFVLMSPLRTK